MSREIKFRAWDGETMHELVPTKGATLGMLSDLVEEEDWKVMQFTGLKDKNGVDIYEDDICQYRDEAHIARVGVVEWRECEFYIKCVGGDDEGNQDLQLHPDERIAVFGNIHQSPDLLEPTT